MKKAIKQPVILTEENEILEHNPIHSKRKVDKTWILYARVVDMKILEANSWFTKSFSTEWTKDSWNKFNTVELALRELNKIGRTYARENPFKHHWKFAGREFKLVNKESGEEILLDITDKEVILK